ncbi:hypothetical protein [Confluentibacter lentus]|uniref:hypothetical protein n=1 Tax=Confluentibacter lentus TaxID=1699412 RepID=UPI000C285A4E|nr:hypothetical protein [Confluentibacter lentus]
MKEKSEFLNMVKDLFPVFYLVLLCLGFFSHNIFYKKFEIEIMDYLTIQEVLFSFIPIGLILIIIALFASILFISKEIFNVYDSEANYKGKVISNERIRYNKITKFLKGIKTVFSKLNKLYLSFVPMIMLAYFILTYERWDKYFVYELFVWPVMLMVILFFNLFLKYSITGFNFYINVVVITLLMVFLLMFKKVKIADRILMVNLFIILSLWWGIVQ